MKKHILSIATVGLLSLGMMSCGNSSNREEDSMGAQGKETEQSDTTYMEAQDNNGQPTTDHDGGTVSETKGAPESGYGNANNTELQPSPNGSSGSAAGTGDDEDAGSADR
jgi:hypothetical protein